MNTKSRGFLSPPITQKMSKLSAIRQPQSVNQRVLNGLFSKEFLINLKNQLNQNRSPRNRQQTSLNDFCNMSSYKTQIQNLQAKLRQLMKQNQDLKQKISQNSQKKKISIKNDKLQCENTESSINKNKLKVSTEVSMSITGRQFKDDISKLMQKIENLQMYKAIRQKRFQELLQKIARYQSQIMMLKVKGDDLESQIRSLRQTIKIKVLDMNGKPWRNTNISDNQYGIGFFRQYDIKLTQEENEIFKYMVNFKQKHQNSLIQSSCKDVSVPDQMHISQRALKTSCNKIQAFNQIDYLISQELAYLQVSQEFKQNDHQNGIKIHHKLQRSQDFIGSLQQSHIFIDLDSSRIKNAKNKGLDQSIIKIQLETKQIHEVLSSKKLGLNLEVNILDQSLVAINLNDF